MAETAPAPAVIPSLLAQTPDLAISKLAVELDQAKLDAVDSNEIDDIVAHWRFGCFLGVAQIFLQANAALTEKLTFDHIKPRLLGHFGTGPGLSLAYAHTQALIRRQGELNNGEEPKFLFVTGPGHGAPAILSQLWAEGAISHFYPEYDQTHAGLDKFVKAFSWPKGFPSHVNSETPGAIHEGGELGYALGVAYGSVFDNPDLVTVVVVGDGESETGPTATAWHSHKWLDPKESGAIIPLLHVNGAKISERTLPGTMDKLELSLQYSGLGYQVHFVDYENDGDDTVHMGGADPADRRMHVKMAAAMDWAYAEIRKIQTAARSGTPIDKPRWPMLIVRSPKGWTGPLRDDSGVQMLNSFHSHQVPLPAAKKDEKELAHLERWLKSYEPEKFFDLEAKGSVLRPEINNCLPKTLERKLGFIPDAYKVHHPLEVGDWKKFGYDVGGKDVSCMKAIGKYLADAISKNPETLRIFSPDELASNKLDGVFEATHRNFQPDPDTAHRGGRVTEMLSEHTLQAWMQGYTLTGRTGIFPSYEAFLGIVATMLVQYSKFTKMAMETSWRIPKSSMNYIETSTWTRQEHNGYSHQAPSFISTVLQLPTHLARVYFPADANISVSVMDHCLRSKGYVNLIVGTKSPTRVFLSVDEAQKHCVAGASIWENYSVDNGVDPDVVLVGIGFELTEEVISAAEQLKKDFGDDLRVRVVNVVDLLVFAPVGEHPHALTEAGFTSLFPPGVPVVINYHGYASQLRGLLYNRPHSIGRARFSISGYSEQGTTTTPWLMLRVNDCDRFSIAKRALQYVVDNFNGVDGNIKGEERRKRVGKVVARAHSQISWYEHTSGEYAKYAEENQNDAPEIGQVATLREG